MEREKQQLFSNEKSPTCAMSRLAIKHTKIVTISESVKITPAIYSAEAYALLEEQSYVYIEHSNAILPYKPFTCLNIFLVSISFIFFYILFLYSKPNSCQNNFY